MAGSLVLTHLNHSWCLWNHKCRWVWALLCQSPERLLGQVHGVFSEERWDLQTGILSSSLVLPFFLSVCIFEKGTLIAKTIPVVIRKTRGWFMIFWQVQARGEPFCPLVRGPGTHSSALTSLEVFPDLQWHQCFNFTADCDPIPLSCLAKKG